MKKFLRFLKAIPYFCLILSIICCSLMMAIPVSAAGPLVGGGTQYYYCYSDFPDIILPDGVSDSLDDCIFCYAVSTEPILLFVPNTSLSCRFESDGYLSFSGDYSVFRYVDGSWSPRSGPSGLYPNKYSSIFIGSGVAYSGSLINASITDISRVSLSSSAGVLDVASGVGSWFMGSLFNAMEMFYADGALTFLGYLAIAGLAFSVIFLIIGLVSRFLKFGG